MVLRAPAATVRAGEFAVAGGHQIGTTGRALFVQPEPEFLVVKRRTGRKYGTRVAVPDTQFQAAFYGGRNNLGAHHSAAMPGSGMGSGV